MIQWEIRVEESLDSAWSQWFSELEIILVEDENGTGTVLRGTLPDQAAFFGVLNRVRNLNLTLVEVKRIR